MVSPLEARNATRPVHYPTMMFIGIGSSIAIMLAFKLIFKPQILRQQRLAGEECADTLLGPLVTPTEQPKQRID